MAAVGAAGRTCSVRRGSSQSNSEKRIRKECLASRWARRSTSSTRRRASLVARFSNRLPCGTFALNEGPSRPTPSNTPQRTVCPGRGGPCLPVRRLRRGLPRTASARRGAPAAPPRPANRSATAGRLRVHASPGGGAKLTCPRPSGDECGVEPSCFSAVHPPRPRQVRRQAQEPARAGEATQPAAPRQPQWAREVGGTNSPRWPKAPGPAAGRNTCRLCTDSGGAGSVSPGAAGESRGAGSS